MAFSDVVEGTEGSGEALALQEQVAFLNGQTRQTNESVNDKGDKIERERQDDVPAARDKDRGDPRQLGQIAQLDDEIFEETYLLAPDASQLQLPQDRSKDASISTLFNVLLSPRFHRNHCFCIFLPVLHATWGASSLKLLDLLMFFRCRAEVYRSCE